MATKMHTFTHVDASGFKYRTPQVDKAGHIKTEAKIFDNPWISVESDPSRCAKCGAPGCFGGGVKDVEIGCPFEHNIPAVQENFQAAIQVLADNKVFETLKALSEETFNKIDPFTDPNDPQLVQKLVRYPIAAFDALREQGLKTFADENEKKFNRYMREAFKISEKQGPMHDLFGRICPDSLCKDTCTTVASGSVEIPKNMAIVYDYAKEAGFIKPPQPKHEIDKNILIVGSGFAALTAAYKLRDLGYGVTIVERNKTPAEPGNNQILSYKVVHERFNFHVQNLKDGGVNFITGIEVGQGENTLDALKEKYNAAAIMIATGAGKAKTADLKGDAAADVVTWEKGTGAQQAHDNDNSKIAAELNANGKRVVIIGTSDTAVDAAMTATLQGAKEVLFVSRREGLGVKDHKAYKNMRAAMTDKGTQFTVVKNLKSDTASYRGKEKVLSGKDAVTGEYREVAGDIVIFAIGNETGDLKKLFKRETLRTAKDGHFDPIPVPQKIATKSRVMGTGAGLVDVFEDGTPVLAMGDNVRQGGSLAAQAGRDAIDAVKWLHEEWSRTDGQEPFAEAKLAL